MKNRILKLFLVSIIFILMNSCERESTCKTEKQCFSDASGGQRCVDTPIPGTCIDNFGF